MLSLHIPSLMLAWLELRSMPLFPSYNCLLIFIFSAFCATLFLPERENGGMPDKYRLVFRNNSIVEYGGGRISANFRFGSKRG